MAGVNKVILIGNLGADPEVKHLENGTPVASLRIATSETYKDRTTGERKTITEWHDVVLWRGLAEIAEKYLKKGNQVYIEGKLRTRQWQDNDGNNCHTTKVVANTMTMLGGRQSSKMPQTPAAPSASQPATQPQTPEVDTTPQEDDDLPF